MTMEERLDRLEKQNRNLRKGLAGLLMLVLVVPLCAFVWQDKKPKVAKFDVLHANRIFTKGLSASDAIVGNAKSFVRLSAGKDGGAYVSIHSGPKNIYLAAKPTGKAAGSWAHFVDGKTRLAISANKKGPRVDLTDSAGRLRATLGATTTVLESGATTTYPASTLTLFNDKEIVVHQVPK